MPPTTRSDQGFSSAVSTVSVNPSIANDQRQGDFQPSFEKGDFQYQVEVEYFELIRLLQEQNKIPPRTLAEVILDLFSDDEEVAKTTVKKWEQLKLDAVRFKGITDTVKNEDGVWFWDAKSNYPMRYGKHAWIPVLVNIPNMTMTGIVSPKHQKAEVDFRWENEEYANGGYAARVVSFVIETVANDRPVLLLSTTIIRPQRMSSPHPIKGRGNANPFMQETLCLVLS